MPLPSEEAAKALEAVEVAQTRSLTLFHSRLMGAYALIWGPLWIIGYTAYALRLEFTRPLWWGIWVIGFALPAIYMFLRRKHAADLRVAGAILSGLIFGHAILRLFPSTPQQTALFWPLLVALSHVLLGLWLGRRFVWTGVLLAVLTILGYTQFPNYFGFWMAFVGGGSLILIGLWLRRI